MISHMLCDSAFARQPLPTVLAHHDQEAVRRFAFRTGAQTLLTLWNKHMLEPLQSNPCIRPAALAGGDAPPLRVL